MAYNVLIVDDSKVIRLMIGKTLRLANIALGKVFEAGDGKEALKVLEKEWVDMVIADINMPVMTGIELVDEMATRGMLDSTPVVIVSTERSVTRIQELQAKGVKAYLSKPFTPENIREVVVKILGDRKPVAVSAAPVGPTKG